MKKVRCLKSSVNFIGIGIIFYKIVRNMLLVNPSLSRIMFLFSFKYGVFYVVDMVFECVFKNRAKFQTRQKFDSNSK